MAGHAAPAVCGVNVPRAEADSPKPRAQAAHDRRRRGRSVLAVSHLDPFRRKAPAGPSRCWTPPLASPCDASLSRPTTWPAARGSGLVARPEAVSLDARAGSEPQRGAKTRGVAHGGTRRRNVDRGSSARKGAAERDNARRQRARTLPAARSSKPPISGHGARTVMKVRSSEPIGAPEGLEMRPRGLRLFGGPRCLHPPRFAWPSLHR